MKKSIFTDEKITMKVIKQECKCLKRQYNKEKFINKRGFEKQIDNIVLGRYGKSCKIWCYGVNNKTIECDSKVDLYDELVKLSLLAVLHNDIL